MWFPLNDNELIELKAHTESGNTTKSNLCKGCLEAEGPRSVHRTVRDVDTASHVLHIDITGPFLSSDDGYSYFLVGALRQPGFPLLINVRLLTSRTSVEVCDQLERMIAYFEFEPLQFEGSPLVKHLASRDFTVIEQENSLFHTLSVSSQITSQSITL